MSNVNWEAAKKLLHVSEVLLHVLAQNERKQADKEKIGNGSCFFALFIKKTV